MFYHIIFNLHLYKICIYSNKDGLSEVSIAIGRKLTFCSLHSEVSTFGAYC